MRIAALSDLHGTLPEIGECDLCLIAGDVMPLSIQHLSSPSIAWLFKEFLTWLKNIPCRSIYMVAGNHDKIAETNYPVMKALEYLTDFKFTYLQNTSDTFVTDEQSLNIYGSPQCHKFGNWSFMHEEPFLDGLYSRVPDDIDIWITHDTPKLGDLDLLPPSQWNPTTVHAGGESLAKWIIKKRPKLVICGHLHTCKSKILNIKGILIVNVSILNNSYENVYKPTYIEYTNGEFKILDSQD